MQLITDVQNTSAIKIYDLDDSGRAIAELALPRHVSYDHAVDVAEVIASKAMGSEPGVYNVWAEVYTATHVQSGVVRRKATVKRINFVAAGDAYADLCYGAHHEKLGTVTVPLQLPIAALGPLCPWDKVPRALAPGQRVELPQEVEATA